MEAHYTHRNCSLVRAEMAAGMVLVSWLKSARLLEIDDDEMMIGEAVLVAK